MPIPTPFHHRTAPLTESHDWREWSGYLAPSLYEPTHEREYFAIRNAVAFIDVSPLFKYDISGPDAGRLVDKIMIRNIGKCRVGQVMYSAWCDEAGKMIDDGTVWRLGEDHYRITAADPSLRWFQDCGFGLQAQVTDVSQDLAALAVQGPNSRRLLKEVVGEIDFDRLPYYRLAHGRLDDFELTVTRTGFTGDLGYELWVRPEYAIRLWDRLMEQGRRYGAVPAGMLALDIARIEAGLLLIEVDYVSAHRALIEARKSSPYEVGLGWAVALDKGPFIGRQALQVEKAAGSAWAFVGLEIDWPALERLFAAADLPPLVAGRASRQAVPVYNENGRQVGQLTSSTFSPILKKYIGLATVESAYSAPGSRLAVEITVEYVRRQAPAVVMETPFYDPTHKRS